MSRPARNPITCWATIVVLVSLAALAIDSFFYSTSMTIPLGRMNAPAFASLEGGTLKIDWESTPARFADRTFKFLRSRLLESPSPVSTTHLLPQFQKFDGYKYDGATAADRKLAQAAGIRTPKVEYTFSLPVWLIISIAATVWYILYKRRARRLAKEEWELAQRIAAS